MRATLPLAALALLVAGCGETVPVDEAMNEGSQVADAGNRLAPVTEAVPVRVGEQGPSFDACAAAGTTRRVAAGDSLAVRAAPFETAAETGRVPSDARFFVCSRSHDQKWFGIVWDESGTLAPGCGVSGPVTPRQAYQGPCRSGWVSSAFVKLISGVDQAPSAGGGGDSAANGAAAAPSGAAPDA